MTPALTLQPQFSATLIDKKGKKSEGRVDAGDTVEIQGPFNTGHSISVEKFLTDSAYDRFGSPQARLDLLKSGEGTCRPRSLFFRPFQDLARDMLCQRSDSELFPSTKWADGVVETAQTEYETRLREKIAVDTFPVNSQVTQALREAMIQDPSLRKDHLVTKLSKSTMGPADSMEFVLNSARTFLKNNPKWTLDDLAEINRAIGNLDAANQLKIAAQGGKNYAHLILRAGIAVIYLPTGKAADILKK